MGLGLSMVKSIVETYNGSINFTSEKNQGTKFIITLPKETYLQ
jgi:signal transduction histidine kinase